MNPAIVDFIVLREQTRINRETKRLPPEFWTEDEAIARFSFCNVNREDDNVTRWIAENVRPHLVPLNKAGAILNVFLTRVFNHPPSLKALGVVVCREFEIGFARERMLAYQKAGHKLMRGAYMMGSHGPAGKGVGVVDYYFRIAMQIFHNRARLDLCTSFSDVHMILGTIHGLGAFVINQIVADLRYMPQFECAPDWTTFLLCGPGTRRGMNAVNFKDINKGGSDESFTQDVLALRDELCEHPRMRKLGLHRVFQDPNNVSNCLCEYDKWLRAHAVLAGKEHGGKSRLRLYKPSRT